MTVLRFSIPFLLTNILQACYGASDLFMVGWFSNAAGISAVATGGQVMQTITGLAIGLTTGGTVIIAQYFGAGNRGAVVHAVKTILLVFGAIAISTTIGLVLFIDPICRLMSVPAEALQITRQYLLICSAGIPFIVCYNAVSGILRGLGDSKTPLLLMIAACLINVTTDLLFVGVMKWGAPGAAISTVFAQIASLALAGFYLASKGLVRRYRNGSPRFQVHSARGILSVGLPAAMQEGLVNISFLMITAMMNGMGLVASASVGVVEKLIVFSMLPTTAFASAVSAMTAQNLGAGYIHRAYKCMRFGIGLALLFGIACFLCAQCNASGLVGLFTRDPAVIQTGALYLRSYSMDCILVCFVFCMNAFFTGCGHAAFPLIHSILATFVIRVPLSYLFSRKPNASLLSVGLAAPAATFLSLICCVGYLARWYKKENMRTVAFSNCRLRHGH